LYYTQIAIIKQLLLEYTDDELINLNISKVLFLNDPSFDDYKTIKRIYPLLWKK
jgi:hypothetical protein